MPTSFIGLTTAPIGPDDTEIHFQSLQPTNAAEVDMIEPTSLILRTQHVHLMHYMPPVRFLQLLRSRKLHMTSLSEQGKDPNDGVFPAANSQPAVGINVQYYNHFAPSRDAPSMLAHHETVRRQTYIHCWYESLLEDRRMWEEFAGNGQGIIMISSSRDLFSALNPFHDDYLLDIDKVRYVEDETQLIEFVPNLPTLRKDVSFAHENEVRLLARLKDTNIGPPSDPAIKAIRASIDLSKCLKAIIFGPLMCDSVAERIAKRVRATLPKVEVLPSNFRGKWFSGKPSGW